MDLNQSVIAAARLAAAWGELAETVLAFFDELREQQAAAVRFAAKTWAARASAAGSWRTRRLRKKRLKAIGCWPGFDLPELRRVR